MTDLTTTLRPTSDTTAAPTAAAVTTPTSEVALITEQQVRFSTAAAVALPATKSRRWTGAIASLVAAVRSAAGPPEPVRRHHSERHAYLQNSLMAREMDRL
jgi:hypothetical protein